MGTFKSVSLKTAHTKFPHSCRVKVPQDRKLFLLLAETFQALGDSSRVQIVWLLSHGEHSVGAIAETLQMSQPTVSHHLRTLRNLRLVKTTKEGRSVVYRLDDKHIEHLLKEGIDHVQDFM